MKSTTSLTAAGPDSPTTIVVRAPRGPALQPDQEPIGVLATLLRALQEARDFRKITFRKP